MEQKKDDLSITVMNSMNKGRVDGNTSGFWITNIVTRANNVVSIGEVIGSSDAFTFWAMSIDVDMIYCMEGNCKRCDSCVTLFVCDNETKKCKGVEDGVQINSLLNEESKKQGYGMIWNNDLELVGEDQKQDEDENSFHGKNGVDGNKYYDEQKQESLQGFSAIGEFFQTFLANFF